MIISSYNYFFIYLLSFHILQFNLFYANDFTIVYEEHYGASIDIGFTYNFK